VGVRGGRIQNVVNELGGEKIDVVQWHAEMGTFIANSLSPAKVMNVILDNGLENSKTATVIVPDRQLSLAIGKEGQNARLAAKLTGWRIDIKSATEAAEETLGRLEDVKRDPEDMDLMDRAEAILRDQGEAGFSEEERELVDAAVDEREIEAEPVAEVEAGPEAEAAVEAVEAEGGPEPEAAVVAVVAEAGPEAEPEAEAMAAEGEEPLAEGEGEAAAADAEPAMPDRLAILDGDEDVPTFEGEQIEDSLGWLPVEPEEDYYSGWSEAEEEEEEQQPEWVREDIFQEEPATSTRRQPRKKRSKRRGRSTGRERSRDW
jgi:N utilization substance protein A